MISPVFIYDSREKWFPVGVEESLAELDMGLPPEAGGVARLNFPNTMKPLPLPTVVYHRIQDGGHLWWHQFWVWILYNAKAYAGVGAHEGDWEMAQIGCTDKAGDRPVLVTGSQHHTGGKREFWRCELRGGRPVLYSALGSHAMYFSTLDNFEDECDGKGEVLEDYEIREFSPAWSSWPGRWGASTGQGKSPESPGCQGHRWSAPHLFHGQAR